MENKDFTKSIASTLCGNHLKNYNSCRHDVLIYNYKSIIIYSQVMGDSEATSTKWQLSKGVVLDVEHHSSVLNKLLENSNYSNMVLVTEDGAKFPAHRAILAARQSTLKPKMVSQYIFPPISLPK